MIICGFLGARFGKRLTLGYSILAMGIGIGLCAIAPNYSILFTAILIAGLGEGIIEGLATPFTQDLHVHEEPGRYISFSHSFWSVGIFITVLLTGWLMLIGVSWRYIILGVSACGIISSLLYLLPKRHGQKAPENKEVVKPKEIINQAKTILKIPRFWLFFIAIFFAGGGEFCLTYWSASYIQINLQATVWAGGLGTAIFALGMFVSRTCWGYIIRQKNIRLLILYSAITGLLFSSCLQYTNSLWVFFVILFVCGIATGPFWPGIQSYTTEILDNTDSTMVFILLSCAGIPGCGMFTLIMGIIGDHYGLAKALFLVPVCFSMIAIIFILDHLQINRKAKYAHNLTHHTEK
jgi:fucose permease